MIDVGSIKVGDIFSHKMQPGVVFTVTSIDSGGRYYVIHWKDGKYGRNWRIDKNYFQKIFDDGLMRPFGIDVSDHTPQSTDIPDITPLQVGDLDL